MAAVPRDAVDQASDACRLVHGEADQHEQVSQPLAVVAVVIRDQDAGNAVAVGELDDAAIVRRKAESRSSALIGHHGGLTPEEKETWAGLQA